MSNLTDAISKLQDDWDRPWGLSRPTAMEDRLCVIVNRAMSLLQEAVSLLAIAEGKTEGMESLIKAWRDRSRNLLQSLDSRNVWLIASNELEAAWRGHNADSQDPVPVTSAIIRVNPRVDGGWKIESNLALTDVMASVITFRAEPDQVVMGDFVEVIDPDGIRIGHVATATYRERLNGPAYVVVTIALR